MYNELSQKNRFQSVPIPALCLYNIVERENLVFKNLSVSSCDLCYGYFNLKIGQAVKICTFFDISLCQI